MAVSEEGIACINRFGTQSGVSEVTHSKNRRKQSTNLTSHCQVSIGRPKSQATPHIAQPPGAAVETTSSQSLANKRQFLLGAVCAARGPVRMAPPPSLTHSFQKVSLRVALVHRDNCHSPTAQCGNSTDVSCRPVGAVSAAVRSFRLHTHAGSYRWRSGVT
jgi:hypothetical protein